MTPFQATTPAAVHPEIVFARWRLVASASALLITAAVAFGVAYLVMNNAASTKGFTIRSLEQRITVLEEQKKRLDIEVVTARSLKNVEARISAMGLVPVAAVEYVNAAPPLVAMR